MAAILFTLFPSDYDNLLRWLFSELIHLGIRDQLDPLNTWTQTIRPDQDPAYKQPTILTNIGLSAIIINNFIPHSFFQRAGLLTPLLTCSPFHSLHKLFQVQLPVLPLPFRTNYSKSKFSLLFRLPGQFILSPTSIFHKFSVTIPFSVLAAI